ncbi:tetratricopeptide repeat protein [Pseudemcibacter aquimaris]|uniref:tetratricopeptide repeat protein n=1 Tax=Pseudemcibacter aquimaris TaxID=2857064 RepID=UPI0020113564|nr:tetratricopeptide repeat protein [Pseudemcibacter aquimaris]MCC3860758.1 tetratricopeptide repeat protein [Pseudemcibacter aquimaris]WDU59576.1 tetratricopeptide repeat protein [Pseudemcibacter aquimaris]
MNKAARVYLKQGKKLEAQGKNAEAISVYETALNENPGNPEILFALGNVAKKMGMYSIAEQMFRAVYGIKPDSIEAATNLAIVINEQDRPDEAIDIYQALLALNPEHVPTWINVGNSVLLKDDLETAEIFYNEALRLKSGSVEAMTNLADIYLQKKRYEEALTLLDKALKRDKRNALIRHTRGDALFLLGRLEEGWKEHDFSSWNRKDKQKKYHHQLKRWKGEDLTNKRILLTCEQGIGDQMRYLSALEDIISTAKEVVVEIDERLVEIFARTYPEITVKSLNVKLIANVSHFHYDWDVNELDYADSMLGACRILKNDINDFSEVDRQFVTNEALDQKWKERLTPYSDKLKVGICWRSGKQSLKRNINYPSLEEWGPIIKAKDVHFFNLMYDDCAEEIEIIKNEMGVEIITFDDVDYKNDLEDVFSLIGQLDLTIGVMSAPANMACVLGKEALVPFRCPGWETFGKNKFTITPSIQPFFQNELGKWEDVMAEIANSLNSRI